jgi:chorismate mutase
MIGVKDAVALAKAKAVEILGATSAALEEIERETYKDRDVWSITLGVPRDISQLSTFAQLSADPVQYKRFLIDVENGELLAMRIRELASR